MEDVTKEDRPEGNQQGIRDCGCEGNCCPPKKGNRFVKLIFGVVILAALGIIAVKVFRQPPPAAASAACCPAGSESGCDTTTKAACDTARGSSCCPKN